MLFSSSIAVAAVLVTQVLAKDSTQCYTAMTSKKPAGYPLTKWSTHYTPCTTTVYSTKLTTSTPKVTKTETIKSTTTVTDPKKGVSTTTKTITVNTSKFVTTTSTATASTTIDATKSITNPAPAGFIPVQSSLPGSSFNAANVKERSLQGVQKRNSPPKGYGTGKTYPKQVNCHKYTNDKHCATKKVIKTKTVTAKPYTVTVKSTKIVTSTKCPGAKGTVTATSTVTKTSTSTAQTSTTSTSTSTNIVATTTVNAACLTSSNFANQVSGMPLAELLPIPEDRRVEVASFNTNSAFACCNAALNPGPLLAAPQLFSYSKASGDAIGLCEIVGDATTCGNTQSDFKWEAFNEEQAGPAPPGDDGEDFDGVFAIGNARCGVILGPQSP